MNSSNSSRESGNTKQIPPALHWFLTWNNYPQDWKSYFMDNSSISANMLACYIIGKEVGEEGTAHLQGNVTFTKKVRPKNMFPEQIHWEKTKKLSKAIEYCQKDGDYIVKGYKIKKPVKIIEPTYKYEVKMLKILEGEVDDRKIYWLWSKAGKTGKTSFCKYLTVKHGAICLSGKSSDIKNGIVEYKKANGIVPEIILIDIPRSFNSEYLSYEGLESVKNMYFYSGKYEGGMICDNPPHMIIFSNEEPDRKKLSADRWDIWEINTWPHED